MKWFDDGDQIVVTNDDFVDLQSSPAVFIDSDCYVGKTIKAGGILALPVRYLVEVMRLLRAGGGIYGVMGPQ